MGSISPFCTKRKISRDSARLIVKPRTPCLLWCTNPRNHCWFWYFATKLMKLIELNLLFKKLRPINKQAHFVRNCAQSAPFSESWAHASFLGETGSFSMIYAQRKKIDKKWVELQPGPFLTGFSAERHQKSVLRVQPSLRKLSSARGSMDEVFIKSKKNQLPNFYNCKTHHKKVISKQSVVYGFLFLPYTE